ncbi:unnamed protein product, partial [Vitis vinifera]
MHQVDDVNIFDMLNINKFIYIYIYIYKDNTCLEVVR